VTDQDRRRAPGAAQLLRGRHQVGDVRREGRVGELAFARAKPGEVETQHRDAERRQAFGDAPRGVHVLAAGEAVREQRIGARRLRRTVEEGGEPVSLRIGEIEPFGRHGPPPLPISLCP